jgi:hypothetical protein
MKVEQQQLYLTQELREALKTSAKSQRRSVSSLAEELLIDGLSRRGRSVQDQQSQLSTLQELARSVKK